ncbi:MAG: hypothetical protein DMG49_17315 [Acidobacteria bacterium]|nr:MAG: hypothetical protein DMG49_17315 [Acidobacteriota bacterium]
MLIHLTVYSALPLSAKPQVCANSPTPPLHALASFHERLSRNIRDDHCCSLTQLALSPHHPFEPFLHTLTRQFLIQNA